MEGPSPERIMAMMNGFQQSQILKGALELGLFTELASGHDTAAALAQSCGTDPRATEMLCDALTVLGLVGKSGGRYHLSPEAALFLDRRSPAYLGGMVPFLLAPEMVANWSDIAGIVRRGGRDDAGTISPENPLWVEFAKGMVAMMAPTAELMTEHILAGGVPGRVLDVAAGHGLFGIAIARRAPDCQVVALDWPKVLEIAAGNASAAGVAERWAALPGSAFDVPWGTGYDVVLLTNFLHHFDPSTCEQLLAKARDALAPGGRVVTLEFIPNEDGVSPPMPALFGMVMLTSTPAGRAYRFSELAHLHEAVGLTDCRMIELPPTPQRLVVARRA